MDFDKKNVENICNKSTLSDSAFGKWISVKERLPDKDDYVLVWMPGVNQSTIGSGLFYLANGLVDWEDLTCCRGFSSSEIITHWMPLPEGPKRTKMINLFNRNCWCQDIEKRMEIAKESASTWMHASIIPIYKKLVDLSDGPDFPEKKTMMDCYFDAAMMIYESIPIKIDQSYDYKQRNCGRTFPECYEEYKQTGKVRYDN